VIHSDESGGNDLHSSFNTVRMIESRRIRWERHVESNGERTGVCRVMLAKPEGKRPLGNPKRALEKILNSRGMEKIT